MERKWRIGEVAKLFDLTTDTLRYYEKQGLLKQHKNPHNGYRGYAYDEVVMLMDILFFRQMDVAVKDVRQIVREKELPEISAILRDSQRSIEEKLAELTRQQRMLQQVISQYQSCETGHAHFSLVAAPDFQFKFLGRADEDLFAVVARLKEIDRDWIHSTRYALQVTPEQLADGSDFSEAQLGLSLEREELLRLDAYRAVGLQAMAAGDYLYTIVATSYEAGRNPTLAAALEWLRERNYRSKGPLIGRYMASCHKQGLDYYEIWLAVEKT